MAESHKRVSFTVNDEHGRGGGGGGGSGGGGSGSGSFAPHVGMQGQSTIGLSLVSGAAQNGKKRRRQGLGQEPSKLSGWLGTKDELDDEGQDEDEIRDVAIVEEEDGMGSRARKGQVEEEDEDEDDFDEDEDDDEETEEAAGGTRLRSLAKQKGGGGDDDDDDGDNVGGNGQVESGGGGGGGGFSSKSTTTASSRGVIKKLKSVPGERRKGPEEEADESGAITFEPFHLRAEREEGYFDESGGYVWKRKSEEEKDPWLEDLDNLDPSLRRKIQADTLSAARKRGGGGASSTKKSSKKSNQNDDEKDKEEGKEDESSSENSSAAGEEEEEEEEEEEDGAKKSGPIFKAKLLRNIVNILQDGEKVTAALQRLGKAAARPKGAVKGSGSSSTAESSATSTTIASSSSSSSLKRRQHEEGNKKDDEMNSSSYGEANAAAAAAAMRDSARITFDALTEAVDGLVQQFGMTDAYTLTKAQVGFEFREALDEADITMSEFQAQFEQQQEQQHAVLITAAATTAGTAATTAGTAATTTTAATDNAFVVYQYFPLGKSWEYIWNLPASSSSYSSSNTSTSTTSPLSSTTANQVFGPFSSEDMNMWVSSGYFAQAMPYIREVVVVNSSSSTPPPHRQMFAEQDTDNGMAWCRIDEFLRNQMQ